MTAQADVGASADVGAAVPLLAEATRHIGHFQIRNRGTIGGSIAHADPAAEYPAVALALDAELDVESRAGRRTIPAGTFFEGTWTTALAADELLVAVRVPVWEPPAGFAVAEIAARAGDFAIAGVACAVRLGAAGAVERSAIALIGLGPTPLRAPAAVRALIGARPDGADLAEIGRLAVADIEPPGDWHASGGYRRKVGGRLVAQALGRAIGQANGAGGGRADRNGGGDA
jgi:carbon-monoxide dehydrogenase medium subunit